MVLATGPKLLIAGCSLSGSLRRSGRGAGGEGVAGKGWGAGESGRSEGWWACSRCGASPEARRGVCRCLAGGLEAGWPPLEPRRGGRGRKGVRACVAAGRGGRTGEKVARYRALVSTCRSSALMSQLLLCLRQHGSVPGSCLCFVPLFAVLRRVFAWLLCQILSPQPPQELG